MAKPSQRQHQWVEHGTGDTHGKYKKSDRSLRDRSNRLREISHGYCRSSPHAIRAAIRSGIGPLFNSIPGGIADSTPGCRSYDGSAIKRRGRVTQHRDKVHGTL